MGDRWELSDREIAEQKRLAEEQAREQTRVRAIKDAAEKIWVQFVHEGRVPPTELTLQKKRVARQKAIRTRLREIEQEQKKLEKEMHEIYIHCIHLDEKGESAFERGMYDICRICPDMR